MQSFFYGVWLLCSIVLMVMAICIALFDSSAPGSLQVVAIIGGLGFLLFVISCLGLFFESEVR